MLAVFRKIAFKLAVLAGIPIVGVLLLATEVERSARDRSRTADAIGSIEDLAELSTRMSDTVDELQTERAFAAFALGLRESDAADPIAQQKVDAGLLAQEGKTDAAIAAMNAFLGERDRSRLPGGLREDLEHTRIAFEQARNERRNIAAGKGSIISVLEYYGNADDALIDATAALTRLSNDGEMLRGLASLVAIMQVQECDSREHAVLSHTFARGEFAPGQFRYLVTLVTEQQVQAASLRSFATTDQAASYRRATQTPAAARAAQMLKAALEVTEGNLGIDAADWFATQQTKVHDLARVEAEHAQQVQRIASRKVAESRRAVRYGEALVIGVVLVSILLAVAIGRGITRNILSLAKVAGRVQREKDFSLRAVGRSEDELGMLTCAFNEMLTGIQDRDRELESHRANLERLVTDRTLALSKRNRELRLVLDTVEQGLATLDKAGHISSERSRAFDSFFGAPPADEPFFKHIASGKADLSCALELDWAQLTDGFLPLELALAQAKDRIQIGENHYTLGYKPILDGEEVTGALLMVSDVTGEMIARRNEAAQREQFGIFMRLMKDRAGFLEFFEEARQIFERVRENRFEAIPDKLRAIHTLKGNAALFDVASVAEAAHELEQAIADATGEEAARHKLGTAWERFTQAILPALGEDSGEALALTRAELEEIVRVTREGRKDELDRLIIYIQGEPLRERFSRVANQLQSLSLRLGKAEPEVVVSGADLRVPPERFASFWAAFAHVVRNVVDHGLESSEERERAGKAPRNRVTLGARLEESCLVIEVTDDGRGIDWREVAVRAKARGLPHLTRAELSDALFAPGLTTAAVASETSGRGVGMSAVLDACRALGGRCTIESEIGRGTKLTFILALNDVQRVQADAPRFALNERRATSSAGSAAVTQPPR